jgi:molecular chaperone DnaK
MSHCVQYGIDLGTTNSCVARYEEKDVRIFQNNDQMNVTPSAIRVLRAGRVIIGHRAYSALADDPDNVATEFKRWMGQKDRITFPASGRSMSAEELSAEVLKSLRADVHRQTGDDMTTAVITVPAAFGLLQCEATARAAQLAGLTGYVLLQEPIAAAIAYGVTPAARNQRWLVFDLGGGTLDIAIVSTRDGRLNVIEHRGNNLLGGKDIDRALAETLFLPLLKDGFALPQPGSRDYRRLLRRLLLKAEEARIDLGTVQSAMVTLFELGEDRSGVTIEAELEVSRPQLEALMEPLLDRCLLLVDQALDAARISGADIDRIILVGGPTQMPVIRSVLGSHLGARLDYSLDPMTVVARGAALYASTLEQPASITPVNLPAANTASVRLVFDPISPTLNCPVGGRVESSGNISRVRIDSEGGYWTSGWVPVVDGVFEVEVVLVEGQTTRFSLSAADATGRILPVDPGEFTIRHGLVFSAPPLPHTLSVEVVHPEGETGLDPVIRKGTPLPAEKTFVYRAAQTLDPGDPGGVLAIKLWEGEVLNDPGANTWVANLCIFSVGIRRSIPEGAEIEVTVKVDASRLTTVDVLVPRLNQHFSMTYLPEREERVFSELAKSLPQELSKHTERLAEVEAQLSEGSPGFTELDQIRDQLSNLSIEANRSWGDDPDEAKRLVEASREIRAQIAKLEDTTGVRALARLEEARLLAKTVAEIVGALGFPSEQDECEVLRQEVNRSLAAADARGLRKAVGGLESLRLRVLSRQDWFWQEMFAQMSQPGCEFTDDVEAKRWLACGKEAVRQEDVDALRVAVLRLWELQPQSDAEASRDRAVRAGLKRL